MQFTTAFAYRSEPSTRNGFDHSLKGNCGKNQFRKFVNKLLVLGSHRESVRELKRHTVYAASPHKMPNGTVEWEDGNMVDERINASIVFST